MSDVIIWILLIGLTVALIWHVFNALPRIRKCINDNKFAIICITAVLCVFQLFNMWGTIGRLMMGLVVMATVACTLWYSLPKPMLMFIVLSLGTALWFAWHDMWVDALDIIGGDVIELIQLFSQGEETSNYINFCKPPVPTVLTRQLCSQQKDRISFTEKLDVFISFALSKRYMFAGKLWTEIGSIGPWSFKKCYELFVALFGCMVSCIGFFLKPMEYVGGMGQYIDGMANALSFMIIAKLVSKLKNAIFKGNDEKTMERLLIQLVDSGRLKLPTDPPPPRPVRR